MSEKRKIPQIILEAYSHLLQHRIVEITQPLNWNPEGEGWSFEFRVPVIYPNRQGIPSSVELVALIPEAFPLMPVDFYPKSREVLYFPHQSIDTGKLCLPSERLPPRNSERLVCYVKWAIEWLSDAAKGTLLKIGAPYELPQFLEQKDLTVYFSEENSTYENWRPFIGKSGVVECAVGKNTRGLFVVSFCNREDSVILETGFTSSNINMDKIITGEWFILPDIRYYRHRPPFTFQEMNELCSACGLQFYDILKRAWDKDNRDPEIGLILVGFPIPKIVGCEPFEIHWQPLLFENMRADRKRFSGNKRFSKPRKIWIRLIENGQFSPPSKLPWGKSVNITDERLYSRGSHAESIRNAHVAIFGCGALGSSIAELLVRGGVKKMDLFDPDIIQFGNLCRHTLDGRYVGMNKAESLAKSLSSTNPLSLIKAHPEGIPLTSGSSEKAQQAINGADILIDCTTSDSAFEWLNNYAVKNNKILISVFFDFYAKHLTLCISGKETPCGKIYQELFCLAKNNELPVSSEEYFYEPDKEEEIIEGAGCWHPTFPALYNHIQILAAAAVDLINEHLEQGGGRGLVAIVKRNRFEAGNTCPFPLVTIIWAKDYL